MSLDAVERALEIFHPGEVHLTDKQLGLVNRELGPRLTLALFGALPPIAGGAPKDDEDDDDEEDQDVSEKETNRIARRAAAALAAGEDDEDDEDDDEDEDEDDKKSKSSKNKRSQSSDDEDEDDEDDDEDDTDVSDTEVKAWLKEVTSTPEIKAIIREASKQLAAREVNLSVKAAREELEDRFNEEIASLRDQLASGRLTPKQATKKAKDKAEKLGEEDDSGESEADALKTAAEERDRQRREQKLALREIRAYRREQLQDEDQSKLIPEMIAVDHDTSEADVDEMIEASKARYTAIRKQIIRDLKEQGWKSPKQLKALARSGNETDDEDEEDEDDGRTPAGRRAQGPPTRENEQPVQLSSKRRQGLRSRFGYGDQGADQNASQRRVPTRSR